MSWFTGLFSWLSGLFGGGSNQSAQVAQIQASAVRICAFLPTAESVLAVATSGNAAVVTVSVVAHQICEIVTKQRPIPQPVIPTPLALGVMGGADAPRIQTWKQNGITIQGAFVK